MIEKYTLDLRAEFPDKPKVHEKMILVKTDLESHSHVVMKMLSYLIFYDPRLVIEKSIDMHYKPDLVIPGDHGVPELWIDCGKIALKKVDTLSRKLKTSRLIVVKENQREMESFRKLIDKKVENAFHVEYLAFEPGFVTAIGENLKRTNQVMMYEVMENVIGVALNDEVFESTLYR